MMKGLLTQNHGIHVREGPGCVKDDVKLAGLKQDEPSCRRSAISPCQIVCKKEKTRGIGKAKSSSHDKLGMLKTDQSNDGLGDAS